MRPDCRGPFHRCFFLTKVDLVVDPSSIYTVTGTNSVANCSIYDITRDIPSRDLLNRFRSVSAA
jgi:hypothetical protein